MSKLSIFGLIMLAMLVYELFRYAFEWVVNYFQGTGTGQQQQQN